jgi:hypothetical protein
VLTQEWKKDDQERTKDEQERKKDEQERTNKASAESRMSIYCSERD